MDKVHYIDKHVVIGKGTELGPFVVIHKNVKIKKTELFNSFLVKQK